MSSVIHPDPSVTTSWVYRNPALPVRVFREQLVSAAAQTHRLLCMSGVLLCNANGRFERVADAGSLAAFLGSIVNISCNGRAISPSVSDARAMLTSADLQRLLPQVRIVTRLPMLNSNWQPCTPGYNVVGGVFLDVKGSAGDDARRAIEATKRVSVAGQVPALGTESKLGAWLDSVCFKTAADRARYLCVLLSFFVRDRFRGAKPLVLIQGNQPGIGKTWAARAALELLGGPAESASVTLARRDVELARSIYAAFNVGRSALLFDNVRLPEGSPIDSPTLERVLTDAHVDCPARGARPVRVPNNLLLFATWNGGQMTPDLAQRVLPIRLHHEGDPRTRLPTKAGQDLVRFVRKNRAPLYFELLSVWERWRHAGQPRAHEPFRFALWASLLGGVLKANGIDASPFEGLDGAPTSLGSAGTDRVHHRCSAEASDGNDDSIDVALALLARDGAEQWLSPSSWVGHCRARGLLKELLARSDRAAATALGRHLTRRVGRCFAADGVGLMRLHVRASRNGRTYALLPARPLSEEAVEA
jgi:hypothetical protein